MGGNFCTQCGKQLAGAARFCSSCGSPIGEERQETDRYAVNKDCFPGQINASDSDQGESEKTVQGIGPWFLDRVLYYSIMNAPLDTDFLMVEDPDEFRYVSPLEFIQDLPKLKVHCSATALYVVNGSSPSARDCFRTRLPSEVSDAFVETQKRIEVRLEILPFFEPQDYGELDADIRGKWVTVKAASGGEQWYEVVTVVPLTPSGIIMKHRLREHEAWLKELSAEQDNASLRRDLGRVMENIRSAIQTIPDGFVDHLFCQAFFINNGHAESLALIDEETEQEDARAEKKVAFNRISRISVAGAAFPRREPARENYRRSLKRAAVGRRAVPFWRPR
jgi:hypothetical protein